MRRRTSASVAIEVSPSVSGVGTTSRSMNLTRPRSTDLGSSGCPPWFWWAGWISMTSHVTAGRVTDRIPQARRTGWPDTAHLAVNGTPPDFLALLATCQPAGVHRTSRSPRVCLSSAGLPGAAETLEGNMRPGSRPANGPGSSQLSRCPANTPARPALARLRGMDAPVTLPISHTEKTGAWHYSVCGRP